VHERKAKQAMEILSRVAEKRGRWAEYGTERNRAGRGDKTGRDKSS
jgi:hypothetical protein